MQIDNLANMPIKETGVGDGVPMQKTNKASVVPFLHLVTPDGELMLVLNHHLHAPQA